MASTVWGEGGSIGLLRRVVALITLLENTPLQSYFLLYPLDRFWLGAEKMARSGDDVLGSRFDAASALNAPL